MGDQRSGQTFKGFAGRRGWGSKVRSVCLAYCEAAVTGLGYCCLGLDGAFWWGLSCVLLEV